MSRPSSKLNTTILALDYGSKRVGVAIKASGTDQVEVVSTVDQDDQFWTSLRALLRRFQPDQIVLGWPRNADAEKTSQTTTVELFAKRLQERTKLQVQFVDEFDSSNRAQQLLPKGLPLRKQRAMIDQYAAKIILQDYLQERTK